MITVLIGIVLYAFLYLTKSFSDKMQDDVKYLNSISNKIREENESRYIFLSSMTHEINTCMTGILGMQSLLKKSKLEPKQDFYCDSIKTSTMRLLDTINDITEFTKMEPVTNDIYESKFDLHKIIKYITLSQEYKLDGHVSLKYVIDDDVPVYIKSDFGKIKRILINIIDNAIKYTKLGSINIHVHYQNDDIDMLLINVIDTGCGIKQKMLTEIFKPFIQGNDNKYGGSGLGLSIANKLIKLIGGFITVNSVINEGSDFCCHIPIKFPDLKDDTTHIPKDEILAPKRLIKVLLADDDNINTEIITQNLTKSKGYSIDSVTNGNEVLKYLEYDPHFDILLLDISMPGMNGYDVAKTIRSWKYEIEDTKRKASKIPIIAISALPSEDITDKCIYCGINDHVTKPYYIESLQKKMKKLIEHNIIFW